MVMLFYLPVVLSAIIVYTAFFNYLFTGKIVSHLKIFKWVEISCVFIVPVFYLFMSDIGQNNDCCTGGSLFSSSHRIGIYSLIICCMAAYLYSAYRKRIAAPVPELVVNSLLVTGIVINILLCIHINTQELGAALWLIGNVPVIMVFVMMLAQNQKLIALYLQTENLHTEKAYVKFALYTLKLNPLLKYPLLFFLVLPFILFLSLVLLMFGQKPDSLIRAFTDTYKHGFSELDYLCDNVNCGGHYLCSVAANGHKKIVKPQRLGLRNGNKIICNRQLLISNAFEALIEERFPLIHKLIRQQYNKVGNFIHRYYRLFNNKYISDFIYLLMKPLEWAFILVLYTFYINPENRISTQYLSVSDSNELNMDCN